MVEPITATYSQDNDDWTITVAGMGKTLTARAPGIIAARDRTDQLVEKLQSAGKSMPTVVHLLNGSALEFTTAYMTARMSKPEPSASEESSEAAEAPAGKAEDAGKTAEEKPEKPAEKAKSDKAEEAAEEKAELPEPFPEQASSSSPRSPILGSTRIDDLAGGKLADVSSAPNGSARTEKAVTPPAAKA